MQLLTAINDFLWSYLVAGLLLLTGVYYTIRLGFPQIRHFRRPLSAVLKGQAQEEGAVSGFAAFCAVVRHPADQGLAAMLGTFITTIMICSCTGFAILLTGAMDSGKTGIGLVQTAFASTLGMAGKWIVLAAMFLFGFTTLIADVFYGEASLRFLCRDNTESVVRIYKIAAIIMVFIGSLVSLPTLWTFVDLCAAFLVIFNLFPLIGLFRYVRYTIKDYDRQLSEHRTPEWEGNEKARQLLDR